MPTPSMPAAQPEARLARVTPLPPSDADRFQVIVSGDEGRRVVALVGELDLATAPHLVDHFRLLAEHDPQEVRVELGELRFLDASGLGSLALARRLLHDSGSELVLASPPNQVRRLLDITGLSSLVRVVD